MEKHEIAASLKAKSAITFGPQDYIPYIWVDSPHRAIRFTTDNEDCKIEDVMKDVFSPLSKNFMISHFALTFHLALYKDGFKMTDDFDVSLEAPKSDDEQISEIIQFIQNNFFPSVKTWSVKSDNTSN
jgi:hypothetical protein